MIFKPAIFPLYAGIAMAAKMAITTSTAMRVKAGWCRWGCLRGSIRVKATVHRTKTTGVAFRHKNSAMNVLYVDGHVGTINWSSRTNVTRANWQGRGY